MGYPFKPQNTPLDIGHGVSIVLAPAHRITRIDSVTIQSPQSQPDGRW